MSMFFFQAEDGIRDKLVTGVQTCALPIYLVSEVQARRANAVYLPEFVLPPAVVPTASLEEALQRADIVVAAVPSHGTRAVIRSASRYIPRQALIVSATKGLEQDTLLRISEV